jgi:hypothetical protein
MNTITSPIRPAAAVAATDASVPEVSSNNDVDDNSSSDAQAGTVSFSLGGIGGDGNSFGGIGVNGGGSLSIGTIVVGSNDGSDASQQLDTSPPTPVFTGKRRAAGLNRGKDGAVEVLSLSASVYGYRLSGAQWSSVNTRAKTAPSPFSREPYSLESLDAIVNHDPFNAARVRPLPSYHMAMTQPAQPPSQDSANLVRQRQQERQRFQQRLRLLGTVLGSGHGSFVMCQNGNAPPKMVHIGEQIDGYTLASLTRGTAVFTSPSGERLDLRTGLSDRSRTDAWNRRRRLGNSDQQADNGNVGQQVGQGIQNAIQQLFQGGLPPGSKVQISPSSPAPSQ